MFRPESNRLAVAASCLICIVAAISGCGEGEAPWYAGIEDLERVPVSADLAPALEEAIASLDDPPATGRVAEDLARYEDLVVRLKQPDESQAAGEEVYRLWQQDPANFLWIELAKNNNRYLRRTNDLTRMGSLPQLSDTTTALGAYAAGRLRLRGPDRSRMFRLAESRMAELDTLQQIWLSTKLANVDFGEGDVIGSVRRLVGWLPAARIVGGAHLETMLWSNISSRLTAIDRLDDGLQAAVMAAAKARQADNSYRALRAELRIAEVVEARQEHQGALALLERAIRTAESDGFVFQVQLALSDAASIQAELGDYEAALDLNRRNLAISVARDDRLNAPRNLASIAYAHRMLGDMDSCYVYLQRASQWIDQGSDQRNRSMMATSLAEYHCLVGEYDVADSLLMVAKGLSSTSGTEMYEARLLLGLIDEAIEMGRADRAYAWLDRVAELESLLTGGRFDLNLRAEYEILTTRLLAYQGEYGRAAEALGRAEREVAAGGGEGKLIEVTLLRGELAQLRGDWVTAHSACSEALALAEAEGSPVRISDCRLRLASVLAEGGQFGAMRELFEREKSDEGFGPRFRNHLAGLLWRGIACAGEGDHAQALQWYDQALAECTPHSPLDLVARLQIEKSVSLVALARTAEAEAILTALYRRLSLDPERPAASSRQLFQSSNLRDATELLIGLRLDHPKRSGTGDAGDATLELVWPCLAPGTAPVQPPETGCRLAFFAGRHRSFVWTSGQRGTTACELPGRDELRRYLIPWMADLSAPGREVDPAVAQTCARLLLGSAAGIWLPGEPLYVIPDGLLHDVPWPGLLLPPEFGDTRSRYAIDHGPVVLGDAAPEPAGRAPRPLDRCTLLAIGCDDPGTGGADTATPLRNAEREARRTAEGWPGPRAELLVGTEATWSRVTSSRLGELDVIHLASHAEVYPGRPRRSTLRLTAGDGDEPVTPQAVSDLDLNAELVFLSCCNAARRLSTRGGGTSDFTAAFLEAGSRTVIASTLWVDDDASEYLAEAFYRNWGAGMGKAEALRASLQQLREAREIWSHPAYWAFYRLTGAAD